MDIIWSPEATTRQEERSRELDCCGVTRLQQARRYLVAATPELTYMRPDCLGPHIVAETITSGWVEQFLMSIRLGPQYSKVVGRAPPGVPSCQDDHGPGLERKPALSTATGLSSKYQDGTSVDVHHTKTTTAHMTQLLHGMAALNE